MKRKMGQYMTPQEVCALLVEKVAERYEEIIDLAAGDCGLLRAFASVNPSARFIGVDLDEDIIDVGRGNLPQAQLICGDGLDHELPPRQLSRLFVANPPYGFSKQISLNTALSINTAFPSLKTAKGRNRLEIQFLAKYLNLIREGDKLVIVLPASFADGERYREYRKILMNYYQVTSATEFSDVFEGTEAKTVALIISKKSKLEPLPIKIFHFDFTGKSEQLLFSGTLLEGERLDAKYYKGNDWGDCTTLQELGVTISRGRHSNKQASRLELIPIHTSDLSKSTNGKIEIPNIKANREYMKREKDIFAQAGDILLSRTGSRVSWSPVVVVSGAAPITDHVFRIRLKENYRQIALESFQSPRFQHWLNAVCKGVCATVLTKQDLLKMPIFSMAG